MRKGRLKFLYTTCAQYICRDTEDAREGVKAFVAKRAPQFKGR